MIISIAMATFNGAKFIDQQIASVLSQTFADFELVICDDCSTDATVTILKSYAQNDIRIKVFENSENLGFAKNFEKLVSLCTGKYLAFCDQDDIWEKDHLESLFRQSKNAKVICGNELLFDNETKETRVKIPYTQDLFPSDAKQLLWTFSYTNNLFSGNAMLIERAFLEEKNILPIPDGISHDAWIVMCACCFSQMRFIDKTITNRRLHHANATGRKINEKNLRCRIANRFLGRKKRKAVYQNIVFAFESLMRKIDIDDDTKVLLRTAVLIARGKASRCCSIERLKGAVCLWRNYKKVFFYEKKNSLLRLCIYLF